MNGPYMSTKDAAAYLGLTEKALREAVRRGKIPARRLGSLLRFTADDLDQLVTPCPTCTPTSATAAGSGR